MNKIPQEDFQAWSRGELSPTMRAFYDEMLSALRRWEVAQAEDHADSVLELVLGHFSAFIVEGETPDIALYQGEINSLRAQVESLKRSVLEESKKVATYSDREDKLRAQHELECRNHRTVVREYQQVREVDAAAYNEMKESRDKLERELRNVWQSYEGMRAMYDAATRKREVQS